MNISSKLSSKILLGTLISFTALATVPTNWNTKFNLTADVPESIDILFPDLTPAREIPIVLLPENAATGGAYIGTSPILVIRNNSAAPAEATPDTRGSILLRMDDELSQTSQPFFLETADRTQSTPFTIDVNLRATAGGPSVSQTFINSGDSKTLALTEIVTETGDNRTSYYASQATFVFKTTRVTNGTDSNRLFPGLYTGTVYATLSPSA